MTSTAQILYAQPATGYHADPAVNASALATIAETGNPAMIGWKRTHPPQPSPAMRLGSCVHSLLLEPDSFDAHWHVCDTSSRATKTYKEEARAYPDHRIILASEFETVQRMVDNVLAVPLAVKLLEATEHEASLYFDLCDLPGKSRHFKGRGRARIDMMGDPFGDLKTTRDAGPGPRHFGREVSLLRIKLRMAWYRDAIAVVTGDAPSRAFLIAVANNGPCQVGLYELTRDDLDQGRGQYRDALEIYLRCQESGVWDLHPKGFVPLETAW